MFISKAEKKEIQDKLETAYTLLGKLNRRLAKLEGVAPAKMQSKPPTKWTPERRAEQAERIKKMWADKRQAKLAANTVMGVKV
jgi:chorismate mutase